MSKLQHWLKAFRLRTLPLSLSCIFIGSGLALYKTTFSPTIFVLAVITTVLLQILSNLANDYGDAVKGTDNENRIGPMRAIQSGAITQSQMKKAIIVNAVLAFISGLLLIFTAFDTQSFFLILLFILLGISAIIAAVKYTMGKNPYGYSGLGDLFVFLFFGLVGVLGTYFLYTKSFDLQLMLPASAIGLLSAAVLNMNNMRDVENDKASNKNTLVVKIGFQNAKYYHTALITLAFLFLTTTILSYDLPKLTFLTLAPFIVLTQNVITTWKTNNNKDLDPELKKIALSTFFISLLFFFIALYMN
ncbi:MAG: 1,4-dihydroxy-2-naphthoate polyprenyltransferase [Flavobacteriales bacterium]|jgi:1,4-dihydroxy-2-naphthoate octaprenyltransferase|nr:1,4-dihydroxy-2-naphthoate polyprenyltransferase [Flavobacteriales bacterium]